MPARRARDGDCLRHRYLDRREVADRGGEEFLLVLVVRPAARRVERARRAVEVALQQERRGHAERRAIRRWVALERALEQRLRQAHVARDQRDSTGAGQIIGGGVGAGSAPARARGVCLPVARRASASRSNCPVTSSGAGTRLQDEIPRQRHAGRAHARRWSECGSAARRSPECDSARRPRTARCPAAGRPTLHSPFALVFVESRRGPANVPAAYPKNASRRTSASAIGSPRSFVTRPFRRNAACCAFRPGTSGEAGSAGRKTSVARSSAAAILRGWQVEPALRVGPFRSSAGPSSTLWALFHPAHLARLSATLRFRDRG